MVDAEGEISFFASLERRKIAFPDAFFCCGVPGTNCLWNKRCNGASCSTLQKKKSPFLPKLFIVQQKSGGGMAFQPPLSLVGHDEEG